MKIRNAVSKLLLWALNSRLLNGTPCEYAFVGNVDNFSETHLRYEVKARPELTVAELLKESEIFKTCQLRSGGEQGFSVIEDGEIRDATVWDAHELRNSLTPAALPENAPTKYLGGRDGAAG
jgi:hypothetical protein